MTGGYSIENLAIGFIVLIAIIAIAFIFLKVSGIVIPPWVWQIVCILVAAVLCIAAIKFLISM